MRKFVIFVTFVSILEENNIDHWTLEWTGVLYFDHQPPHPLYLDFWPQPRQLKVLSVKVTENDEPVAQPGLAGLTGGGTAALYTVTVARHCPERNRKINKPTPSVSGQEH